MKWIILTLKGILSIHAIHGLNFKYPYSVLSTDIFFKQVNDYENKIVQFSTN